MSEPPPLPSKPSTPTPIGQQAGTRLLLPVGRSGWAIAAGYAGLFSFIAIGAPFAILFGILAIRDIRRSRGTEEPKHGMGRAIFGIVCGALVIVWLVLAILAKS